MHAGEHGAVRHRLAGLRGFDRGARGVEHVHLLVRLVDAQVLDASGVVGRKREFVVRGAHLHRDADAKSRSGGQRL